MFRFAFVFVSFVFVAFVSSVSFGNDLTVEVSKLGDLSELTVSEIAAKVGGKDTVVRACIYKLQEETLRTNGVSGASVENWIKTKLREMDLLPSRANTLTAVETLLQHADGFNTELVAVCQSALPKLKKLTPKASRGGSEKVNLDKLFTK